MRRFAATTSAIAVAVLLAACGSSGSSGSAGNGEYVDAMMRSYDDASSGVKDVFSRAQAKCVAEGVIGAIGAETLRDEDITPKDVESGASPFETLGEKLTKEQALEVAAVFTDGKCFDLTDVIISQIDDSSSGNPFGTLSKAKVRCLFSKLLDDEAVQTAFANSIIGQGDVEAAMNKAFSEQSKVFRVLADCDISPTELQDAAG